MRYPPTNKQTYKPTVNCSNPISLKHNCLPLVGFPGDRSVARRSHLPQRSDEGREDGSWLRARLLVGFGRNDWRTSPSAPSPQESQERTAVFRLNLMIMFTNYFTFSYLSFAFDIQPYCFAIIIIMRAFSCPNGCTDFHFTAVTQGIFFTLWQHRSLSPLTPTQCR